MQCHFNSVLPVSYKIELRPLKPCHCFISCFISLCNIPNPLLSFQQSLHIFTRSRFHLKKPLSLSSIRSNSSSVQVYHENSVTSSDSPSYASFLAISTISAVISSTEVLNASNSSMMLESTSSILLFMETFWPLHMNQNVLNGVWNGESFPESLRFILSRFIRRTAIYGSYSIMKYIS